MTLEASIPGQPDLPFVATSFDSDGYAELVVVRNLDFVSRCACHGERYRGKATIGYEPSRRIIGLSKLARLVGHYAEAESGSPGELASRVADALVGQIDPVGVGVLVGAEMACENPAGAGTHQTTVATRGRLRVEPVARQEFLMRARRTRRR